MSNENSVNDIMEMFSGCDIISILYWHEVQ